MLDTDELKKYQRHFNLPGFGVEGQLKLKNATVLIVGCGGLGSPVSLYLAAAGVGTIGLMDFDIISESNLQRQVQFNENEIGFNKAEITAKKLTRLNSKISASAYQEKLTNKNALQLIKRFDLVIDCTDNFPTRYLINDACEILNIPFIYGSIYQYEGQVSVFNYKGGSTYRDLFPKPPAPESVPNCEVGGVMGALAGIIGSIQANEAIKLLCNSGTILSNKLFILDSLTMLSRTISITPIDSRNVVRELLNYDEYCNKTKQTMIKEISVSELNKMMINTEDFQLIDVREQHEVDICTLNGELIPLGNIPSNIESISKEKKVVIHCRSGARSGQAIQYLQDHGDYSNLYNLKGGILAWADEIDPTMTKY